MGRTGAVAAAESLHSLGVTHVFGNPGTTELPFVEAIVDSELEYITCLHEDVALGAAAGFATRSRQLADGNDTPAPLAVANVHATPGVAHSLGNLYGARFARAPVLVTAGCQGPRHERRSPPLSGDRRSMVADHVKEARAVSDVDDLPDAVTSAARAALSPPTGPVYLELPLEVQEEATESYAGSLGALPHNGVASNDAIAEAAALVSDRDEVRIVVGDDLPRAGRAAVLGAAQLAERLGAMVYAEPLNGELCFPTDHPHWVGMLPLDPDGFREALDAEAVLFLGCTHPEPLLDYDPPLWPSDATTLWVGAHPTEVPQEPSFDAVVAGDLHLTVDRFLDAIVPSMAADGAGVAAVRRAHEDAIMTAQRGQRQGEIDAKVSIARSLARAATDAVIVDEGVTTGFLLRDLAPLPLGRFIAQSSGGLGYGLPAAVGAAIAEGTHGNPPRPTVALIGDGTYQYYPQTLYTAATHLETPLTVVVPDNAGYGILRDRDVIEEGNGERPLTFDSAVNVAQNASSYGVRSRTVADLGTVESAIADAIDTGGAEVIVVDIRDA